jgi:hypothetical protein
MLEAAKHDAARLLESALNDPDLPVAKSQLRDGEQNYGLRVKVVLSQLGPLSLKRHYLYNPLLQCGRFALDDALGLVEGYSPEVARWMCRAGAAAGSYAAASQDLLTYAGLEIDPRQIQRMVQWLAPQMAQWRSAQEVVFNPSCGSIFCIMTDGTGAPTRKKHLKGRKGKQGARARTREVKVGAVFTHRPGLADQRPLRDHGSTSYIAQITTASDFGGLLRAEALRRGLARAKTIVFLGDGAAWVWKIARVNFPTAICILDYFHALEHLSLLADALHGEGTVQSKRTFRKWRKALLKDKVQQVIEQAMALMPKGRQAREQAHKQIAYLKRNRSRMMYATFRNAGCFIGSGVVEAACKTVVGQRLKQSGMLWSLEGATHLLTVRCALLSGWFNEFWNQRNGLAQNQTISLAA